MKGISAFLSAILVIAATLAIAGIFSVWYNNFIKGVMKNVEEQSSKKVICSNAGIALENVKYNQTNGMIIGYIRNSDLVTLGDIDVEIFLLNASKIVLDENMTLQPGEMEVFSFNLSTSSYDFIRVKTNCSNVYSQVTSSEIDIVT
ncbi:MAG: hypothetical protein QXO84_01765 [Candidatus Aenigmatarchaeota archaeon]